MNFKKPDRFGRRDDEPKPFRIQRRRLGVIKAYKPESKFGFIDAEDFREDVFFHLSAWDPKYKGGHLDPRLGAFVEYELDEEYRARENKLRASVVRLTDRPMGRKLIARDAPHLINPHHPKARRKRPTWRGGQGKEGVDQESPTDPPSTDGAVETAGFDPRVAQSELPQADTRLEGRDELRIPADDQR